MQGVYQTISPHRCPIPKFHFGHGLGIVGEYQIKFSQPICMLFVKPCFDRGVASAFKYLFLTIVSVSLAGCAGTSSPSHSTARPAFPAWMGDTNKTDATSADRAERLRALKTDESAYLGTLQASDWLFRNCQTGTIRIAYTSMWHQEIATVRKNKNSRAQMASGFNVWAEKIGKWIGKVS
jgi:hypothetical protein